MTQQKPGPNPRIRALTLNLALSAIMLGIVLAVVLLAWYPDPYFRIQNAIRLVMVLVVVQLVLGPLLTFILYKPGKKGLWFDLVVITLLQFAALAFGANALYEGKPRFMVYAVDRFNVLAARDVDFSQIRDPRFLAQPEKGPLMVIANMPMNQEEAQQLLHETLIDGKPDLERRPQYWGDYATGFPHIAAQARTLADLREARPDASGAIERVLSATGRKAGELIFMGVIGKKEDFAVVVDPDSGEVLGAVACDPWL